MTKELLKYLFSGPKLRSNILKAIQDEKEAIARWEKSLEDALKNNKAGMGSLSRIQISNHKMIIDALTKLLK